MKGLGKLDRFWKRGFDVAAAAAGLVLTGWIIILAYVIASIDTGKNGFYIHKRIGKNGNLFGVIKIRTMRENDSYRTNVTTDRDPRVTFWGRLFRKTKIDELPQLINVLYGDMSFVGPRPDVAGFADNLSGENQIILTVRPGITGPATLKYRREENILASVSDAERYNAEVLYPDKVRLNREYVENYSFWKDIGYIFRTVLQW